MKALTVLAVSLILAACNNDSGKREAATGDTKHADTGNHEIKKNTVSETTSPFTLNNEPARYSPGGGKHACNLFGNKTLHLYIQGFVPPDHHNKQLDIVIKDFTEKPGTYTAFATYIRRGEDKKDFSYESKPDGFKVVITEYTLLPGNENLRHALISGTFEGDMTYNIPDPSVKEHPLNTVQHFTNGKFEKLNVALLK